MERPADPRQANEMSARTRVQVAPAVMEWARVSSGSSLDEAARRVGQDRQVVADWERGRAQPTIGALEQLAALYDRPLSVFLLKAPPTEPELPADFRTSAGRVPGELTRSSILALRRARRIQRLVTEIREDRTRLPAADISSAEDAAANLRDALGIALHEQASWDGPERAFPRWREALEALGIIVLQVDVPIDDVRGMSLPGDVPVILINEHDVLPSKVFSLFHECGHLVLGAGAICSPLQAAPRPSMPIERAANLFAGAVLVPRAALQADPLLARSRAAMPGLNDTELQRLANRFSVSRQVVWYRLRQAGLISQTAFEARWELLAARRRKLSDLTKAPRISRTQLAARRVGKSLIAELLAAEERGQITTLEALSGLGVRTDDLDRLSAAVS